MSTRATDVARVFFYEEPAAAAVLKILLVAQNFGKTVSRRTLYDWALRLFLRVGAHRWLFPKFVREKSSLQNSLRALRAVDFQKAFVT